jgi:hypothetical protein
MNEVVESIQLMCVFVRGGLASAAAFEPLEVQVWIAAHTPPGARVFAGDLTEDSGEMGLIGEAGLERDLRECESCVKEQLLGTPDAEFEQPSARCSAD